MRTGTIKTDIGRVFWSIEPDNSVFIELRVGRGTKIGYISRERLDNDLPVIARGFVRATFVEEVLRFGSYK